MPAESWESLWSARALSPTLQPSWQLCVPPLMPSPATTQRCIDWNRDILKKELGLTEQDIIDLPALFKMDEYRQARAFFPNMVRPSEGQPLSTPSWGLSDPEGALDKAAQSEAQVPGCLVFHSALCLCIG